MNLNISKMKNQKKINLASLADYEIKKQQLDNIKGGTESEGLFTCACFNQHVNRSMGLRRNCHPDF